VVKRLVKAAEKIVDNNRWPLNAARGVLEGVKQTVKVGTTAAKFIADLTLGGLISIRRIQFDVKIGLISKGSFGDTIEVSYLRRRYTPLRFQLRLKSITAMALDLADAIIPGISGRKKREVEERMKRALPDYSRRHYLPHLYVYRPRQRFPGEERSRNPEQKQYVNKRDVSQTVEDVPLSHQKFCADNGCRSRLLIVSREADEQFERDIETVKTLSEEAKQEAMNYERNHPIEEETKQEIQGSLDVSSDSDLDRAIASKNCIVFLCLLRALVYYDCTIQLREKSGVNILRTSTVF
jgi:hypothetical protein